MGNVGAVMGIISSGDSCLGHALCAGFGSHSAAAKCSINACRSAVLNFTHQLGVQGEI